VLEEVNSPYLRSQLASYSTNSSIVPAASGPVRMENTSSEAARLYKNVDQDNKRKSRKSWNL